MRAYYAYRKCIGGVYPAPTREEVENGLVDNDVTLSSIQFKNLDHAL
jgi:hypothetical protein